ncbi:hypothetical protein PAMP_017009 [Pampus punctatissimus]
MGGSLLRTVKTRDSDATPVLKADICIKKRRHFNVLLGQQLKNSYLLSPAATSDVPKATMTRERLGVRFSVVYNLNNRELS